MLQAIRDKTTGWIAYLIIFLISVPFALWGVNSYLGGGEAPPAALVDGEEITVSDLDNAYANYRRRLAQMFGGSIPEGFGDENILKDQVLTQLVEERALRQYTAKQRYRIGNEQLNRLIRAMPVFQSDGKFDSEIYQAQLGSLGYSTLGFEQEFRQTQAMEQLREAIQKTAFVVPEIEKEFVSLSNQTRKIRYVTLPVNLDSVEIDDTEVEEYFKENANRYMTPERVKIDFIELSLEKIKESIEVDESQLLQRYEEALSSYTSTEIRNASHILLTLDKDATEEESNEVLDQIESIQLRIEQGEDFAELAKQLSEDPGSAAEGGNLGDVEPGMMVQPFESALYSLKPDQVSEPVKTSFGWHLIKLHSVSGGETLAFEAVRDDLENEIKTELAESQIFDLVENLSNITYEQSDSLAPGAEQLGLQVETSDWFDRNSGTGVAAEAQIRNLAFSSEILNQGLNSEAIELADNKIVFIRLNQHQPAIQRPLQEVRDEVVSSLKTDRAREQNSSSGKAVLDSLRSGESLDNIATQKTLEIRDAGFISRDQTGIDRSLVQRVFSMEKPADGLVYEGFALPNGDFALIELSAVLSNNEDVDSDKLESLSTTSANADYQAVLKTLASRVEVVRTPLSELQSDF